MARLSGSMLRIARNDSLYQAVMFDLVKLGILPLADFKGLCKTAIIPPDYLKELEEWDFGRGPQAERVSVDTTEEIEEGIR